MRAYFLIFAFILLQQHLVLSHPGHPASFINKVFARRTRNTPKYVGSTPRQVRFSRYIQEPELQEVQQKLQQSNVLDDVDLEQEIEQQQQQQQMIDYGAGDTKSTPSSGTTKSSGNGYQTQTPFYAETSTARPIQQVQQQMKEEDEELSQISQPMSQQVQQSTSEFEQDADLSQNYMPTKELSYSPVKQMKERMNGQRMNGQQSYGGSSSNGYGSGSSNGFGGSSNGNGGSSYAGGSAGAGGSGFGTGGSAHSEALEDFGSFSEDDNSIGSMAVNIRGEAGKDYPVFASVPTTGFKCSSQSFPGYYGDMEAQCQVFHICQDDGRSDAFLCPNGTIFSQQHFVCVWWYDFDCATTEQFYELNAQLFKESESRGSGGNGGDGFGSGNNGGSVPSGTILGGSVPSELSGSGSLSGKLHSPKENFNKMYMSQIDEFAGVTTSSPSYYGANGGSSNGKTMQKKNGNGNGGFKGVSQQKQQPMQQKYEQQSLVDTVTPSSLETNGQGYETTPYNLDEALGEEIHSETPILEALSLTTNLPKMQSMKAYSGSSNGGYKGSNGNSYSAKGSNGNGGSSALKGNGNGNFYASTKSMPDFGFGDELSFTSPKPMMSYGGGASKGGNGKSMNGKTSPKQMMLSQVTEAPPVKGSRMNGGAASKSPKSMYGGNGNGNGFKSLKSPASNGFKSYSSPSPPSYGGLKN